MAFELSGPGSSPATEMPVDQAQADSLNTKDFTKGFKKKASFCVGTGRIRDSLIGFTGLLESLAGSYQSSAEQVVL